MAVAVEKAERIVVEWPKGAQRTLLGRSLCHSATFKTFYQPKERRVFPKYYWKLDEWTLRIINNDILFEEQEDILKLFLLEQKMYEPIWWDYL